VSRPELAEKLVTIKSNFSDHKIVNKTVNKITRSCADTAGEDSKVSELRFTLCGTVEVETSLPAAVNAQRPTLVRNSWRVVSCGVAWLWMSRSILGGVFSVPHGGKRYRPVLVF